VVDAAEDLLIQGPGLRYGLGFRFRFRVQGLIKVEGSGFRYGLRFRV